MGQIVVVGGSRGIGAATVRAFATPENQVFFLYAKSHDEACALAAETGTTAICADIRSAEDVNVAFQAIGQVDTLILNAGVAHYGLISQITEDQWLDIFDVNIHGMYRCVKAALPAMLARQAGSIVTVSSMWGQVGASCEVAYSATKGAVLSFTKALAKELGPSGIRVNAVAPGVILTDMVANVSRETLQGLAEEAPLGVNGTPEQVAAAIRQISQLPFVTGQILGVNGGFVI